ncbi:hypothetical protein QUF61_04265 [Candidatus Venteria ishoeyi]|uniref:hypothetical protein n=1 Tax=Candidatus Venteria ishoeyi TaxID=1899563 RepID=UPI0025A4D41E|nr:hypothetical protein [Candidatus Venteria ishoeyi]MDM8545690.1 hypothetical protein [Candidatus Venteria ishoeyi]
MDSKTYLQASARTASTQFHEDIVSPAMLEQALHDAISAGQNADAIKKSLFYGKALDTAHPTQSLQTADSNLNTQALAPDVLHAALGLYTEATELLEAVLATMQGQNFDAVNAFEECGDIEWYLAMLYRNLNRSPEEAKAANIKKLMARYPEKFEHSQAVERDLEKEREILESHHRG